MNIENIVKTTYSFIELKEFANTVNESIDSLINKLSIFVFTNAHLINDQILNLVEERKFKNFDTLSDADKKTIDSIGTAFKVIFIGAAILSSVKILQIVGPLLIMLKPVYDFFNQSNQKTELVKTDTTSLTSLVKDLGNTLANSTETPKEETQSETSSDSLNSKDKELNNNQLEQAWNKTKDNQQLIEPESLTSNPKLGENSSETKEQLNDDQLDKAWNELTPTQLEKSETKESKLGENSLETKEQLNDDQLEQVWNEPIPTQLEKSTTESKLGKNSTGVKKPSQVHQILQKSWSKATERRLTILGSHLKPTVPRPRLISKM